MPYLLDLERMLLPRCVKVLRKATVGRGEAIVGILVRQKRE